MTKPTFDEELKLWKEGFSVIGIDEVGRGCFAGPVVAAGVVFKPLIDKDNHNTRTIHIDLEEINDSKLIKPRKRIELAKSIKAYVQVFSIAEVSVAQINKHGIGKATFMAFRKVILDIQKYVSNSPLYVLVDGFHVKHIKGIGLKYQKAIVKGDQKSISIAAASIVAKVHRDNLMKKLDKKYPLYGFARNKGYGTKSHQDAIRSYGLSKIHRTSFNLAKFLSS